MTKCKHETCESEKVSKVGYCNTHYIRMKRGRPMDGPIRRASDDPRRFWDKVEKSDGCWLWTAFRSPDGYGRFMVDGTPRLAHRVAFESQHGPIPAGIEIDHICHVQACVNPSHLRPATRSLNAQNMTGARVDSASGIRGVTYRADSRQRRWRAEAQVDGERHYLGSFETAEEAQEAVTNFRREHMPYSLMDQMEGTA